VDPLHDRADDPLDDPAVVRTTARPVGQPDAVLLTATPQRLAVELGGIVYEQLSRRSDHRPRHALDTQILQPGLLIAGHVGQAQPHGCGRRRLQGHDHADGTPARLIEADTEVGPADRLAFPLVHDDHVDDRVIDLHPLQDPVDAGHVVTGGLQRAGGIRSSPAARDLRRMQAVDPRRHRVPRRR